MNARNMTCIHYMDEMNLWIECLVYVPSNFKSAALDAVRRGVEMFNEASNQEPYGQCIELALAAADIPYLIEYCEFDEYTDEPYPSWVAHVGMVTSCEKLEIIEA